MFGAEQCLRDEINFVRFLWRVVSLSVTHGLAYADSGRVSWHSQAATPHADLAFLRFLNGKRKDGNQACPNFVSLISLALLGESSTRTVSSVFAQPFGPDLMGCA